MKTRNQILSFLIIVGLVVSAASPLCAFISGQKSWIEICGADGSIKTIPVDQEGLPGEVPAQHKIENPCSFCFANYHMKAFMAQAIMLSHPPVCTAEAAVSDGEAIHATPPALWPESRAPPVLLS